MRSYNSTISLKQKTCVNCGKPCIWFSRKRCKSCATVQDILEKEALHIEQDETVADLVRDLDSVFSQFIRLYHADANGNTKCFTCDYKGYWSTLQNGHYISRGSMYLRFSELNCKPQCERCNCTLRGNLVKYAENLDALHTGASDELFEQSRIIYKYSRVELKSLITEYTEKVRQLKKEKHVQ